MNVIAFEQSSGIIGKLSFSSLSYIYESNELWCESQV